jgi:hypothetical protein
VQTWVFARSDEALRRSDEALRNQRWQSGAQLSAARNQQWRHFASAHAAAENRFACRGLVA